MLYQYIKNKQVKCTSTVRYPKEIERDMIKLGYKIKEVKDKNEIRGNVEK